MFDVCLCHYQSGMACSVLRRKIVGDSSTPMTTRVWGKFIFYARSSIQLTITANTAYYKFSLLSGTRIIRGRRGTAISGICPSRSRYRLNDRDNRDKWNPKEHLQKLYFGISSRFSLIQKSSQSLQSNTIPSQAPLKSRD